MSPPFFFSCFAFAKCWIYNALFPVCEMFRLSIVLGLKSRLRTFAGKGNCLLAFAMLRQGRCRIWQILCLIQLFAYSCPLRLQLHILPILFPFSLRYVFFTLSLHRLVCCIPLVHAMLCLRGAVQSGGQLDSY